MNECHAERMWKLQPLKTNICQGEFFVFVNVISISDQNSIRF